jgi:hypothetical protein
MFSATRVSPLAVIFLFGCTKSEPVDTDSGDTETEDTDDTDVADDTDPRPRSIAGSLTYRYEDDGDVVCDLDVDFTGARYAGPCADCDFAFTMSPTIAADRGTDACVPETFLSFLPSDAAIVQVSLFHYPVNAEYGLYDALMVGTALDHTADGGDYEQGPFFDAASGGGVLSFVDEDYASYGTFTRTGDDVTWTWHRAGEAVTSPFLEECPAGFDVYATPASGAAGGTAMAEDLPCDGSAVDGWTFDGTGGAVSLVVDTVEPAADLWLYVSGPYTDGAGAECDGTTGFVDDAFPCTVTPASGFECPALDFPTVDGETYTAWIQGTNAPSPTDADVHPDCDVVTTAGYTVRATDADGLDVALTLVNDDAPAEVRTPFVYDVTAHATITP